MNHPAFEHILVLADKLWSDANGDEACARAIAAFTGDINTVVAHHALYSRPLLSFIAWEKAPLTLAAIAAKDGVDAYRPDTRGDTPMHTALFYGRVRQFLAAFPTFDVNAPCTRGGSTPLAEAARLCATTKKVTKTLQALLDAGAYFFDGMWGEAGRPKNVCWETDAALAAFIAPHVAWDAGDRRAWMAACASLARGTSQPMQQAFTLLAHVLADPCMHIGLAQDASHRLVSEYAGVVATFL